MDAPERSEPARVVVARATGDELGPDKVVLLREPRVGLEAVVVVDNIAPGPEHRRRAHGPDVTVEEVSRLARAMTMKNAATGLAHGGGKPGIVADPAGAPVDRERVLRAFARAIGSLTESIPGPDMGTDGRCMAWVRDEIARAVGLPRVPGGIPLDEIGHDTHEPLERARANGLLPREAATRLACARVEAAMPYRKA